MRSTIVTVALFALAAPALAGTPPVNSFETRLNTQARIGMTDIEISEDPLGSFFGMANSFIENDRFVGNDLELYSSGAGAVAVTGDASSWHVDADLSATASRFFGSDSVTGQSLVQHNFNLDIAAGEGFELAMAFERLSPDGTPSFVQASLRLFRDDSLIFSRTATEDTESLNADFRMFEHTGANYRVQFLMILSSGFSQGSSGIGERTTDATIGLDFAIIPAPVTAAPLALAGVFAARRRRA